MNPESNPLFTELTPPSGGLAKLRAKMEARRNRVQNSWLALLSAGASALVAFLILWQTGASIFIGHPGLAHVNFKARIFRPDLEAHPALSTLRLAQAIKTPVSVPAAMRHQVALSRVPLPSSKVIFYYIGTPPPSGKNSRHSLRSPALWGMSSQGEAKGKESNR